MEELVRNKRGNGSRKNTDEVREDTFKKNKIKNTRINKIKNTPIVHFSAWEKIGKFLQQQNSKFPSRTFFASED